MIQPGPPDRECSLRRPCFTLSSTAFCRSWFCLLLFWFYPLRSLFTSCNKWLYLQLKIALSSCFWYMENWEPVDLFFNFELFLSILVQAGGALSKVILFKTFWVFYEYFWALLCALKASFVIPAKQTFAYFGCVKLIYGNILKNLEVVLSGWEGIGDCRKSFRNLNKHLTATAFVCFLPWDCILFSVPWIWSLPRGIFSFWKHFALWKAVQSLLYFLHSLLALLILLALAHFCHHTLPHAAERSQRTL